MEITRLVISLTGPTGCGKSSLARRLVEDLGPERASRVPADWYLLSADTGEPGRVGYGWDCSRLTADLRGPDGRLVRTPTFDFTAMRRSDAGSAMTFALRPIMIVDAMLAFPGADFVVRLDVPAVVRRARLADRDQRWGTTVLDRWEHLEASGNASMSGHADLVLDGGRPLVALSRRIIESLPGSFAGPTVRLPDGR